MDDIKMFVKNVKEVEIIVETIWVFRQNINIEFDIEKYAILKKMEKNIWRQIPA